ncbi:MAG: hypothetical protein ACYC3B_02540 [Sedimentisphaerales bacterium]
MKRNSHTHGFGGTAGLVALFFFILQSISFAGVAVSPLQQVVDVKPGKKATFSITLTNNKRNSQTSPCPVRMEVLDFAVSDTGQLSFGQEYKNSRSAAEWIKFSENEFVLAPGESKEMTATVTTPIDADGDYWAAVMVNLGESKKGEKGVQVNLRTASGVFIRVSRRSYTERGSVVDTNIVMPDFNAAGDSSKKDMSEQELYELKQKQTLKVEAKLKNDGLIAISARGKASVYTDDWRRVATIPLHASRRQVLPGDSRWFTGIMAQPLPAGKYNLRVFFASDSTYKRKMTKDVELLISEDLAKVWAKNFVSDDAPSLKFEPQQIELKLNPGRTTASTFQVANQSLSTIVADCRIENDGSNNNWLELRTTDFTLAPNGQHSITCIAKVPSDAKPGEYKWNILVEMEQSGLAGQGRNNVKPYKIPVSVMIDENARVIKNK